MYDLVQEPPADPREAGLALRQFLYERKSVEALRMVSGTARADAPVQGSPMNHLLDGAR